jgi:hypothetical protein
MANQQEYRILTPDGRLSHDTFLVALEQPGTIFPGCVLVVNERDGTQLTVHPARLYPIAEAQPKRVCLKCGRVLGVAEDQVKCPYDEDNPCGLMEPPEARTSTESCAEHSR